MLNAPTAACAEVKCGTCTNVLLLSLPQSLSVDKMAALKVSASAVSARVSCQARPALPLRKISRAVTVRAQLAQNDQTEVVSQVCISNYKAKFNTLSGDGAAMPIMSAVWGAND